ncbi:MAG: SDR family oxidoreductase [Flavobacteriaceae bacterium]|nr:SDR family oxidoreductase [Flavobacteriaceae bacterium]
MKNNTQGKWAVILGGSSGLGLASAKALAKEGFNICIVHRDRKSSSDLFSKEIGHLEALGIAVRTFNKDALKNETMKEVAESFSKNSVHVLLHSIAKGTVKELSQLTMEDFKITLDAMALSWWEWTSVFVRQELFAEKARNLAFTSEGNSRVWQGYGAVSVAKAALEALMRQMAVEYASHGLRSNCIQAGITDTPSLRHIPGYELLLQSAQKRNPMSQITTSEYIGNVVAAICREDSHWINGTIIKADGGESLR